MFNVFKYLTLCIYLIVLKDARNGIVLLLVYLAWRNERVSKAYLRVCYLMLWYNICEMSIRY